MSQKRLHSNIEEMSQYPSEMDIKKLGKNILVTQKVSSQESVRALSR